MKKKDFIALCKNTKVLLLGDIMLDQYVLGKVNRISPEAPVPVFLAEEKKQVLGGAGNVFNNLTTLGVSTTFLTAIGSDSNGKKIKNLIKNDKKSKLYLLKIKKKISTTKTRYLVNGQQLMRVDEENTDNFKNEEYKYLLENFTKELYNHNIVVLSDYNKGFFEKKFLSKLIKIANRKNVPIIIDPKNNDFSIYKNATLITPNQFEVSKVTNSNCKNNIDVENCGTTIIDKYSIKNVLITRGEKGLSYINKKVKIHSPTKKIEVFDVSGAGDTVLLIISICIANKVDIKTTLNLSNKAAGLVVGKIGTSTLNCDELFYDIQLSKNKIIKLKELKKIISEYKKDKIKIGFTNGCFDIMHSGHVQYLEETKKLCDKLIVAINSDLSVKKLKGKNRPINNEVSRARVLASLSYCDHIIIFNKSTPLDLIKSIRPDVLTKGGDYSIKNIVGAKEIKSWGGEVSIINLIKGFSTSDVIKKTKLL